MSYQVLARKWRPQVFDDVVGQGHITRTLQNAIAADRLAHAFLFSGPRGVGKTTTARILAKALNCVNGPTPTPCGACDSCRETTAGTSVDVVEIDGASNRGIEHIRELREAVKYAPVGGKYKVFVIDEVHMLTNEAFNALLKTLEEPPPHVLFIFATTEPQKIPATIHSRCQRYGFKRVPLNEIIERLKKIALAEGITITDQGIAMIARAAEGSMRDSQSLLDQAVSYSGMRISDEELQATLGSVAQASLLQFGSGLLSHDASGLLKQVDDLLEQGQDMRQYLSGVVEHIRNLMVVMAAKDPGHIIELPASDIEGIKKQADGARPEHLLMLFDSLSKTLDDMRWSPHQRFTLEVGLIKACSLQPLTSLSEMLGHMKELEVRLASGNSAVAPATASVNRVQERPVSYASKTSSSPQEPVLGSGGSHDEIWEKIVNAVKAKKPGLASFLVHSKLLELTDIGMVVGVSGSGFQLEQLEKKENRDYLEQLAAGIMHKTIQLKIQPIAEKAKPEAKPKAVKKQKSEEQDSFVHDALKIFGGQVVDQDHTES